MSAPLIVSIPHRLGREEAVRRLKTGLVVLRHNCRRDVGALLPQQGHRGMFLMSALINRTRRVAIEFGMWRSGRKGGSSGSITLG